MTTMTKKELIKATKPRYLKATKKEKSKILDEFCSNTGFNRKYAIQIFRASREYDRVKKYGRKSRKTVYGPEVMLAVVKIWELLEYPCGVRLKPSLRPMVKALERHNEINLDTDIKEKMAVISPKTLDRRLGKERAIRGLKRNRGTTRRGSLLKSSIPVRITNWDTSKPGFMEMDTVAHNGGDPSGEFVYSLDLTEIYSGWSEQYAVLGKGRQAIKESVDDTNKTVPFRLKGLDSDTGAEFINWHMVNYCRQNDLLFTRSRPNRKNDNAYVEQKNYTHIRKWLGYQRYDNVKQRNMMNDLYRTELRLFNNFFRPVMKIKSKKKINNSVCHKTYDQTRTPYQRLLECDQISDKRKRELTALYLTLNPVKLKQIINEKIKKIRRS